MDRINTAIATLLEEKTQNEAILDRLSFLDDTLKKLSIKEKAYFQRTEEELADVKRLEETGLKSLFKKVIGNLDEALEKEKQEYLLAVLQHKSVEEEIEVLEYEKELLAQRFRNPSSILKELNDLIKKKEFHLKSYDMKFTKELFKSESELGRYKLLCSKCKAVLEKANRSESIIDEIKLELSEVRDWPPSGKGKYASVVKKRYIDRARAKAIQAKVRLEELKEGIKKLNRDLNFDFDLAPFKSFLDNFYNNLITDYVIQKKLAVTVSGLDETLYKVSKIKEMISKEDKKYTDALEAKEHELRTFILMYQKKAT